ncbi:hypothetical protein BTI72_06100 [Lactobacillus delbrueckii subsp. bulgaricus]|nr:hypothetical protein [Lactobacillus delbrueckii subsp. bulgaricus]
MASGAHWKKYTVAKVSGYTASRATIGAAKVTRKNKNQTIKITYKAIKKSTKKNTKKVTKKSTKKTTPKKRTTVKKPVKKVTPASANVTFYNSKGKPTTSCVFDDKGQKKDNLKKGSKVSVLAQATINGQLMYAIHQTPWTWVPAKDVKTSKMVN